VLVAGPYSITCKTVTGQTITNFNEPISITINLSKKITGKYLKLEYYKKTTSQNWSQINQIGAVNGKVTFQLTNSLSYVILGQPKHTPWWVTLAIILFIIIIIFIVSRFVFRWLIKKHLEDENVESYRKEWGL
jgi:ATP-dependent Zn protease